MPIFKERKNKIHYFRYRMGSKRRRKKLLTTDFSIISNNCYAEIVYQYLHLPYNTPTVGLYFYADEYIKFCENFNYYIEQELKFIETKTSKYYADLVEKGYENKIVGILDDVEIVFLYYSTREEAKQNWDKRCKKLSKNVIFKFSDQYLCSYNHIRKFYELPFRYKICFTSEPYENEDTIYLKKYKNKNSIKENKHFKIIDYINHTFFSEKKSRILFCSLTLAAGGAERVISNLANYFSDVYKVSIALLLKHSINYNIKKNVSIMEPTKNRNLGVFSRIGNVPYIIKQITLYKPSIVIAFCPTMCFIVCFLKLFLPSLKQAKLIISERNNPHNEYTNFFMKWIANFLYSKADIIVFQTEDAKLFFNQKVQKKAVIIPNPIHENFLKVLPPIKKEKTIVTVGRLTEQKNQKLLIRACASVFKKYPAYVLKIYGQGPLKSTLQDFAKKEGIFDKVKFMGVIENLAMELRKDMLFVLPSNYEGMPNALMEAMALGLPCIATDCPCGGAKMLIENNENGILIPVDDCETLKKAMFQVIEEDDFREKIGDNAKKIGKDYHPKRIYSEWEKIIK